MTMAWSLTIHHLPCVVKDGSGKGKVSHSR